MNKVLNNLLLAFLKGGNLNYAVVAVGGRVQTWYIGLESLVMLKFPSILF